jgi:hypothetical protein
MAQPINTTPILPGVGADAITNQESLHRALYQEGIENANRTNLSFPKDGTEDFEAPLPLWQVPTADLPSVSEWEGSIVYDSTENIPYYSDGSAWKPLWSAFLSSIDGLTDPGADRILFWDESAGTGGAPAWLEVAAPLTITAAVLDVSTATDTAEGVIELAATAEVYAGSATRALVASNITGASLPVTLAFGTPTAFDWTGGINRTLTMTGDATLSNPSNGIPGTWRTIRVEGNSATPRVLTFDTNYLGERLADIADATSTKFYHVAIYCHTTSEFWVSLQGSA